MNTLAIIGNGRTRVHAPHGDLSRDVWTMNDHTMLWQKRTTAVFEMHHDLFDTTFYSDEYKDWVRQPHDFPIYMHETHPDIPASVKFPRDEIAKAYGGMIVKGSKPIENFYSSTFPYCLAMALHLGYKNIELFGVDLDKEERASHRDSVFYWMGIMTAHGVRFTLPEDTPLMEETLYPLIPLLYINRKRA